MKQKSKTLTIGPTHLQWLATVFGIYSIQNHPDLEELIGCLPSMKLLSFAAGSEIVKEGAVGDDLFMLYKGKASVTRDGGKIADLLSGDFFGEVGFLVGVPRTATIRAEGPCEVFSIRPSDFDEVLKKYPKLMDAIRITAKERMRKLDA